MRALAKVSQSISSSLQFDNPSPVYKYTCLIAIFHFLPFSPLFLKLARGAQQPG